MDARDVVWVDPVSLGRSPCDDLIAVAEGDAQRQDFEGGIKVFDVTDLSQAPKLLGEHATAGVDRAVAFGSGAITTQSGPSGSTTPANHPGPFLMSVDGPGDPDRFGVWRLFELSGSGDTVSLNQVAIRFVSQSKLSYDTFREDPSSVLLGSGTKFIPNDLGVPVGVASFAATASYIANTPFLGLQAIVLNELNTDVLAGPQIDGQIPGLFRAVTTYRQHVLAAGQEGSDNKLVLADPQLHVTDSYTYAPGSSGDRPLGVAGLGHWLSHPELGSATQEDRDYAVVLPKGPGVGVIRTAIGGTGMKFNPDEQLTLKTRGGRPSAAVADPLTQLLFVADGNAGLTIIDLATPSGLRDDDGDGYDDRILATVDLGGARAQNVAVWRDAAGTLIAGVSGGGAGVRAVQVLPAALAAKIEQVDVCADNVRTELSGTECSRGTLTLELLRSDETTFVFAQEDRGSGVYNDHFNRGAIPEGAAGEFLSVRARWVVHAHNAQHLMAYHIKNLGTYRQSQYNTPSESHPTCQGPPVDVCFSTAPACSYASGTLQSIFEAQVDLNGSGHSSSHGDIEPEEFCLTHVPPQAPCDSRPVFRQNTIVTPSCQGLGLGADTVAVNPGHPDLRCGDTVCIVDIGRKHVTDTGSPIRLAINQLDNYSPMDGRCAGIEDLAAPTQTIKLFQ